MRCVFFIFSIYYSKRYNLKLLQTIQGKIPGKYKILIKHSHRHAQLYGLGADTCCRLRDVTCLFKSASP